MAAHSPIDAVLAAYRQLRAPQAHVLAELIGESALREFQNSKLARIEWAVSASGVASTHGIPPQVLDADRSWLSGLSPAEFLQFVVSHVPVEERQFDVQVVGSVDEGPDRTWVLIRTERAVEFSSGLVISAEEFHAIGVAVEHDPMRPTLVETRRVDGRWVVWELGTTSLALPGTSGFAF